uniref:Uncharacterized protein n=1 Tax=Magallana gigas TaxID=29159 RepID=A0A8W8NST8_MAGGI
MKYMPPGLALIDFDDFYSVQHDKCRSILYNAQSLPMSYRFRVEPLQEFAEDAWRQSITVLSKTVICDSNILMKRKEDQSIQRQCASSCCLYQGKPIYKIKFKGAAQTSWQDGNQIPKTLKDTFHSLYNAKGKKRKRPNKKHFNKQESVQAISLPPKSQQQIYNASIDRRGTHIMFYLENHDGSTTNAKYAHEVPSHLFKPFFKKLEQEISDCKSGKGCEVINRNSTQYFPVSRVLFLKHRPTLFMHHLTPSKARLLKNCHSSPEGILAFKTKLYDHVKLFHTNADL